MSAESAGSTANGGKGAAMGGTGAAMGGTGAAMGGKGAAMGGSGSADDKLQVPQLYPLLRASTPTNLIADSAFRSETGTALETLPGDDAGMPSLPGTVGMGQAVQERLYTAGPTEILRIVHELDSRTSGIDTDSAHHPCLSSTPIEHDFSFPPGQHFHVALQCLQDWGGGYVAFGFVPAGSAGDEDAGVSAADGGHDFYLIEGQDGGMGGAYHVRANGDVEAWLTVADSRAPNNSQVLMHLMTNAAAATTELAFGGSGVGFCSAHLKTGADQLFIRGKLNAPPPPGTPISANAQYCDIERTACFATADLTSDLGAAACGSLSHFAIATSIDASSDPDGNVMAPAIYMFFDARLMGIASY